MTKTSCIYHANCPDGFAAALAMRMALGPDIEFHASDYGDHPPDVTDAHVALVDFSYPRRVLEELAERARSVLVLDHHETAALDLVDLPHAYDWADHTKKGGLATIFDMERSGAQIAWDFFRPEYAEHRPNLIDYVADRDLWRFELPGSREINATLALREFDFDTWTDLCTDMQGTRYLDRLIEQGALLNERTRRDVAGIIETSTRLMVIGGYLVRVANAPRHLRSEVAGALADGYALGACYFDSPKGRVFSLRSTELGEKVNKIAALYPGGGGHPRAAGFTMPIGWEGDQDLRHARPAPR
jgi:oligoribonuclease NrnB/cAMP/cGMP phosphodiesterase (DHH superfamily)